MAEALGECNCGGVPMAIGVQTDMATPALARFGSDELRREFLAPTIAGDQVACLGVSEPGGGSDVAAVKTTRARDGGDYVINGTKMWITNGLKADWCCLLANTSEGPAHKNKSLIVVPMDAPASPAEDPQDRHEQLRHRAAVLRQRARAAAEPDRPGRPGLHLPDAAVPGGAAVGRGLVAALHGPPDRPDHRVHAPAPGLRQEHPRQPGRALPPGRAAHRGRGPARTDLPRGRAVRRRQGCHQARQHGQAQVRPPGARGRRQLPAVLGRHGLHLRQPDLAGLPRRRLVSIGGGADEVMLGIICKLEGTLPGKAG
jgi:citronellyl-CoA dehydrogenase